MLQTVAPQDRARARSSQRLTREVRFSSSPPNGDRVHHVSAEDLEVVLSRLPASVYARLRAVHFNDRARGNRRLGYTTKRGRREIALCALPPRLSFTPFLVRGQSPRQFGALRGAQWPKLAIRRFLLYDVFLHELGHLQIIIPKAKNPNRRFASETKAQEFADFWRHRLWSKHFEHEDPVHNAPTDEELARIE